MIHGLATDKLLSFLLTFQELVAANPSQKNWKGISIAVLVIFLVLLSVFVAVKIKTPEEEGPRVVGDRITIHHILSPNYRPRNFNGSWISGKVKIINILTILENIIFEII